MIITVAITTVVWLAVTFLTRPESDDDAGGLLPPDPALPRGMGAGGGAGA